MDAELVPCPDTSVSWCWITVIEQVQGRMDLADHQH